MHDSQWTFFLTYIVISQNEHDNNKRHDCINYDISNYDISHYLDITMTSPDVLDPNSMDQASV